MPAAILRLWPANWSNFAMVSSLMSFGSTALKLGGSVVPIWILPEPPPKVPARPGSGSCSCSCATRSSR
eukprot:4294458-Pyramimonas_sp.AAC.1